MARIQNIEWFYQLKMNTIDSIINAYKSFNLTIYTLLHSIQLLNKCFDEILKDESKVLKQYENPSSMIIIGLICLNLASKY